MAAITRVPAISRSTAWAVAIALRARPLFEADPSDIRTVWRDLLPPLRFSLTKVKIILCWKEFGDRRGTVIMQRGTLQA